MFFDSEMIDEMGNRTGKKWGLGLVLVVMLCSIAITLLVIRVVFPADILTTAMGYDAMFRPTLASWPEELAFLQVALTREVSVEGTVVGLLLILGTLIFGYMVARSGAWVERHKLSLFQAGFAIYRGEISVEQFNQKKFLYFSLLIFCILADTATDAVGKFRAGPVDEDWMTMFGRFVGTFIAMFLINTILSEQLFALTTSLIIAVPGAYIQDLFKGLGRKPQRKGKPEQREAPNGKPNGQQNGKPNGHQKPHNPNQQKQQQRKPDQQRPTHIPVDFSRFESHD